ncbi:aspartic peptidase domain-containing protein [Mycena metata]|uniref:Aspartic peptidase domain-containing protein n=1 Tax=Mycena metata TaxID=1033252 RepID=A0AAD7MGH7_9AGAR|nr:aspartic peptidase domain-containing protein [Mycena metata]
MTSFLSDHESCDRWCRISGYRQDNTRLPFNDVRELTIPVLDADAELADAIGVRLRYLARHLPVSAPAVDAVVPTNHSPTLASTHRGATGPFCLTNPRSLLAPGVANSTFIPVHTDRGPDPAQNPANRTYDEFLTTTTTLEALDREVVGTLVFGHPEDSLILPRKFRLVFDLGSNDLWVYGRDLRNTGACPQGTPGCPPLFWFQRSTASSQVSDVPHTAKYADGSFARYHLWNDYVYLRPYWAPPPVEEPYKPWLHLTFGVACEISPSFINSPTSGVLGLGRRTDADNPLKRSPPFLQQLRPLLASPEMTILLGRETGYITFGSRPNLSGSSTLGDWHNQIPILGDEHWVVASRTKRLNGVDYKSSNGTAELDTGAAFCYVDDDYVNAYYRQIPGSTTKFFGSSQLLYHLIPESVKTTPRAQFEIGDSLFTLEHSHLPRGAKERIGTTKYYVGAIQRKSLLIAPGGVYSGPDLIGRVALVNMEIVLQMPDNQPHTMSWRRKDTDFIGPSKQQW